MTEDQLKTIEYLIAYVAAKIAEQARDYIYDEDGTKHYFSVGQAGEEVIDLSETSPKSNRLSGSSSSFSISGEISTTVRNLQISGSSFSGQENNIGHFSGNISSGKVDLSDNQGSHQFSTS